MTNYPYSMKSWSPAYREWRECWESEREGKLFELELANMKELWQRAFCGEETVRMN